MWIQPVVHVSAADDEPFADVDHRARSCGRSGVLHPGHEVVGKAVVVVEVRREQVTHAIAGECADVAQQLSPRHLLPKQRVEVSSRLVRAEPVDQPGRALGVEVDQPREVAAALPEYGRQAVALEETDPVAQPVLPRPDDALVAAGGEVEAGEDGVRHRAGHEVGTPCGAGLCAESGMR